MKKFMLALLAFATVCTVSCKKEDVKPVNPTIEKVYMSGGGDKRPSSHAD